MIHLTGHLYYSHSTVYCGISDNSEAWLYSLCLSALKSRDSPVLVLQGNRGDFKSIVLHNGYLEPVKQRKRERFQFYLFSPRTPKNKAILFPYGNMLMIYLALPYM